MTKKRKPLTLGWIVLYFILGAFALCCFLPILLVLIVSFSSEASIALKGFSFFPSEWSLNGYRYMLTFIGQIGRGYLVTIFETIVGTFWTIALCGMFGYVLSRKTFQLRGFLSIFLLITMLFHGGGLADYIVRSNMYHLRNNLLVLILPGVTAYTCIVMRTFIQSNVPDSLIESAKIDGAGEFYTFVRIVVPLIKPVCAAMGFMQAVSHWNSWYNAYLYITNPKYSTLQLILIRIEKNIEYLTNNEMLLTPDELLLLKDLPTASIRMAILMVTMGPILIAYPFFQKHFVKGITIGAVKG